MRHRAPPLRSGRGITGTRQHLGVLELDVGAREEEVGPLHAFHGSSEQHIRLLVSTFVGQHAAVDRIREDEIDQVALWARLARHGGQLRASS